MASDRDDLRADDPRKGIVRQQQDGRSGERFVSQCVRYNTVRDQNRQESEEGEHVASNLKARVHA